MRWAFESDADADGICDDVDPCVGELDACLCAIYEIYECGCIPVTVTATSLTKAFAEEPISLLYGL